MTVRYHFALAALCALFLGAGCGDRGPSTIAEIDEAFYIQGVQLNKQGRSGEALTAFLKVIDKRGERGAPESHLEAGVIYLNHTKEPVLAYYHFKRYLELQANSKEAPRVRSMLDAALRDIARRFPGRPADDPSGRLAASEEMTKLRRENDELRAKLQTLPGSGAMQPNKAVRMITLPDEARTQPAVQPVAEAPNTSQSPIVPAPAATQARTGSGSPIQTRPQTQVQKAIPAPVTKAAPSRTSQPSPATRPASGGSGRTHTVKQSEGLLAIARRFDSANPGRKMREIIAANPDVLPNGERTALKPGMVLRIP